MHATVKRLVDAYRSSREGTVAMEAKDLMKPKLIQKMEVLEKRIRDNFM